MRWDKENLEIAVNNSTTKIEVLKKLGLSDQGGNYKTLSKYLKIYIIDISHFKLDNNNVAKNFIKKELSDILIENSTFNTNHLKERLYKEGIKEKKCELCGQDENWQGKKISLILDHINGINDDNRIENLRIVCPNCNATLDTHCKGNKYGGYGVSG